MKNAPGRFVAFRDADRDGHAEVIERFGTVVYQEGKAGGGTGIGVYGKPAYLFNPARLVALTAPDGSAAPGESSSASETTLICGA